MYRFWKQGVALLALAAAAGLWWLSPSLAKPPGGGGDGTTTPPCSLIELPVLKLGANRVSNPDARGVVTVVGNTSEFGYVSAAYALVNVNTRQVISAPLPEPTDGAPDDFASNAVDVNDSGVIVGGADIADPTIPELRRHVPIRWIPAGSGYTFELLPLSAGDSSGYVTAVNDSGMMVGGTSSNATGATNRAVLWSADGTTVSDLATFLPPDSGWMLTVAMDINNTGLVAGTGLLDGVERAFVLDLVAHEIIAVPLAPGATTNTAWQINDAGHVIGVANENIFDGGPFPQGGWGYFWAGIDDQPVLLPSSNLDRAIAWGLNNFAELCGDSGIPQENGGEMCRWLPNEHGGFDVTAVTTLIPTKPVWYLKWGSGINDSRWLAGYGRKSDKGKYTWMGVLIVPN